jgi:hypothetical protein
MTPLVDARVRSHSHRTRHRPKVLLQINLPVSTPRIHRSNKSRHQSHHLLHRGCLLRICRRQETDGDRLLMLLELDKEVARNALFNRNRLQQCLVTASCQIELLDFQNIGPPPLSYTLSLHDALPILQEYLEAKAGPM